VFVFAEALLTSAEDAR